MSAARPVLIRIEQDDVLNFRADVLILKYAQNLYGADSAVYAKLASAGNEIRLPQEGSYAFCDTAKAIPAARVLFVGVVPVFNLGYLGIRSFARQALAILADESPAIRHVAHTALSVSSAGNSVKENSEIRHIAFTVHGPGYGLDEQEAFESEVAGLFDALNAGRYPPMLEKISIVERDEARAKRLKGMLQNLLPAGEEDWQPLSPAMVPMDSALHTAGQLSTDKQHVFVAMPFAEELDDTFHYGIESAAKAAGMLCERADLSIFSGDIMQWVRERIKTAALVVADLSTANPNVYLEVGYAWGSGIRTVLLCNQKDASELKFDVRGQRCLIYKSIRNLEELLTKELTGLAAPNQGHL